MKTLIIENGVVVNVGVGEPENAAPEGVTFMVVEDDMRVGLGFTLNEDGAFTAPPPPPKPILD